MDSRSPEMFKPTLIAGALFGVLGGLPVIGALNCACCSLIVAGGFFASYLYSKQCALAGVAFRAGNGAMIGLVAGLFYTIASAVVGGLTRLAFGAPDLDQIIDQLESSGVPPESLERVAPFIQQMGGAAGMFIGFLFTLLLAAIFSTIGGLIGGAVFKVEPAPPPPAAGPAPGGAGPPHV